MVKVVLKFNGDIMTTVIYLKEYSLSIGGRKREDSDFSAEYFKEEILIPQLKLGKVVIDFDGIEGISSSWMYGSFYKLQFDFDLSYLKNNLIIKCEEDNTISLEIWSYIEENELIL